MPTQLISGMKSIFSAVCLLSAALVAARADIPSRPHSVPGNILLTVDNLSAFPNVKFSFESGGSRPKRLVEGETYTLHYTTRLLVSDAHHKPDVWATEERSIGHDRTVQIHIKEVHVGKKEIEVVFDRKAAGRTARAEGFSPVSAEIASPFLLGLAGFSGLVLLARRRRAVL